MASSVYGRGYQALVVAPAMGVTAAQAATLYFDEYRATFFGNIAQLDSD